MESKSVKYFVSDDKKLLQESRIFEMLSTSYWAKDRSQEDIRKSIQNSLCFGVFFEGVQIGFARCVTDYSTSYLLLDVIVDESYRGNGCGKALTQFVAG